MRSLKEALVHKHMDRPQIERIDNCTKSMLKSGDVCETKHGDGIIYISSEDIKKSHKFSTNNSYNHDGMFILVHPRNSGICLFNPEDWYENLKCTFNHERDVVQVLRRSPKPDMESIIKDAVDCVASVVANNSNGNTIRRYIQDVLGRDL